MRAEQLALALRPRPMFEAADLGVRMAQAAAPALLRAWLPLAVMAVALCLATVEIAPWLPSLLLWWLKPWLDRGLLFIYARQAFGEATTFADAWAARGAAPWGPLLRALTLARLSPWRAYLQPVHQLEGQAGAVRRRRLQQLLQGQHGAAWMAQTAFATIELMLFTALLVLYVWFVPEDDRGDLFRQLFREDAGIGLELSIAGAYAAAVLFVEPLFVAAGFGMYLNRRVELEAWDVEQDLRQAFAEAPT